MLTALSRTTFPNILASSVKFTPYNIFIMSNFSYLFCFYLIYPYICGAKQPFQNSLFYEI